MNSCYRNKRHGRESTTDTIFTGQIAQGIATCKQSNMEALHDLRVQYKLITERRRIPFVAIGDLLDYIGLQQ